MDDKLNISGVVGESIVDGPGIRYTIFVQGCPHMCPGCHNEHTWSFEQGEKVDITTLYEQALQNPLVSGVTFSGGEPFCQARPLATLASMLHKRGYNIIVYTGYTYEELVQNANTSNAYMDLLKQTDYLIDGRFVLEQKSLLLRFKGSKNQRIIDVKKSLANNAPVLADFDTQNSY